jgi:hydrogenase maturation protease
MKQLHRKKNLVIGLGNPLSRDDAFGGMVLARLEEDQAGTTPLDADLVRADTDLLSQIDRFSEYIRVILVDAILDPSGNSRPPGTVVALEEKEFLSWPETASGAHQISPVVAVKLFRKLQPQANTRIALVGCCTDRVTMKRSEADELDERIVDEAVRLVRSLLSGP